ncbi:MAG: hypothetical protein Q8M76_16255, partial [Spirochaetaceae bacterium]|nr:hypothetical protein [Spirochaetaceae bacterium]
MKKHTITAAPATGQAAYVANGFVGLRVGINPFLGQTALLNGFTGSHERFGVEAYAPVPAAMIDISMDGGSLLRRPEGFDLIEQSYDFSCGELATSFSFANARGQALTGTIVLFCSRSSPSLVIQELRAEVKQPCDLAFSVLVDPTRLPIATRLTVPRNADCDGALWVEGRGGSSTAGIAAYLSCEGEGEGDFREIDAASGYEQERIARACALRAIPGRQY